MLACASWQVNGSANNNSQCRRRSPQSERSSQAMLGRWTKISIASARAGSKRAVNLPLEGRLYRRIPFGYKILRLPKELEDVYS
jgi:hypothetical protein